MMIERRERGEKGGNRREEEKRGGEGRGREGEGRREERDFSPFTNSSETAKSDFHL